MKRSKFAVLLVLAVLLAASACVPGSPAQAPVKVVTVVVQPTTAPAIPPAPARARDCVSTDDLPYLEMMEEVSGNISDMFNGLAVTGTSGIGLAIREMSGYVNLVESIPVPPPFDESHALYLRGSQRALDSLRAFDAYDFTGGERLADQAISDIEAAIAIMDRLELCPYGIGG